MAVIVSKSNGGFSTANNWYISYYYDWATSSSTINNIVSTPRTKAITFSSNHNMLGALIQLNSNDPLLGNDRTVCFELMTVKGTCTFTGSPTYTVNYTSHGLANGTLVGFNNSGGALPSGITANQRYYIINASTNTFQISTTSGGAAVSFTGAGTGTHTLWYTLAEKQLTALQINAESATTNTGEWLTDFRFSSPVAVTNAANTYQFRLNGLGYLGGIGGTKGTWYCRTTPGGATFATISYSDTTKTAQSGVDTPFIANIIAIDTNFQCVPLLTTSETTYGVCGGICSNSYLPYADTTPSGIALTSENAFSGQPSASYTLTLDGVFFFPNSAEICIGSASYPVDISKRVIIKSNYRTQGTIQTGFYAQGRMGTPANRSARMRFQCYGAKPTNQICYLTQDAPTGQNVLNVDRDVSAEWQVGDTVYIPKIGTKTNGSLTSNTIASMTSTTITLTNNLGTANRITGSGVINVSLATRYGVCFEQEANSSNNPNNDIGAASVFTMDGVAINQLMNVITNDFTATVPANMTMYSFKNIFAVIGTTQWNSVFAFQVPPTGILIDGVILFQTRLISSTVGRYISSPQWKSGTLEIANIYQACAPNQNIFSASTKWIFRNSAIHHVANGVSMMLIGGINPVWHDNDFWGCQTALSSAAQGGAFSFGATTVFPRSYNNKYDNMVGCFGALALNTIVDWQATNEQFGTRIANTTDIQWAGSNYVEATFNSPTTNPITVDTTYLSDAITGSFLKFKNYNGTTGDIRSWTKEGKFNSSSGKIIAETLQITDALNNTYNSTSDTIATNKCTAIVNCEIGNSAYYDSPAVYTVPKLTVTYDLTSESIASAIESTSQQTLQADFIPTTSNNPVIISLSQKTTATGTNADVTWDTLILRERKYGYVEQSYTKEITQTIKDVIYNFGTLVTDPFITQTDKATVLAYTGIYTDGTLIDISENHTVFEIYDYLNAWLSDNLNQNQMFTTIDGQNYTSAVDFYIEDGVTVSGGYKINTNDQIFYLGTNSHYTGIAETDTTRLVHCIVSNLVAGSTVGVYGEAGVEGAIIEETVVGTLRDQEFYYTSDKSADLYCKKYGYVPIHSTGNILDSGLLFSVSQIADSWIDSADPSGYTGISINHGTQTLTITENHTLQEIYDYAQYELTGILNLKKSQWLTTSNGTDYTSTYGIVVDGCNITGVGSLDVGANSISLINGAYTYAVIKSTTITINEIVLSNIISGSTVQVYDTTNNVEIYKGTLAATSLTMQYEWTANADVRVRTRLSGYIPNEVTGTILQTGFATNISQQDDLIYLANAIDGSTVTEFSLSEGVIGIFIDDPDNTTSAQRMYNWYMYAIATEEFIDDQTNLITANGTANYVLDDSILLKNLDMINMLFITGANITNSSGTGLIIDPTGGMISINGSFPFAGAGGVADAVWNKATSTLTTAGTTGKQLTDALTTNKFIALK